MKYASHRFIPTRVRCFDYGGSSTCSLYKGHSGDHVAYYKHDLSQKILKVWNESGAVFPGPGITVYPSS